MEAIGLSRFDRYRISEIITAVSRLALAGVFLSAAVPKLLDWQGFAVTIGHYKMLPAVLIPSFALFLASLEFVVGMLLLTGTYVRVSAWIVVVLNVMFIGAMGQAMIRGIDTSCGCFGASQDALSIVDVLRDVLLLVMAGLVLRGRRDDS